jgi:predicted dienelactone hydrolase
MRPWEALLAGLLTIWAISLFVKREQRPRLLRLLPVTAILLAPVLLAAVQLLVEGYRWQIVPLYGLTVTGALLAMRRRKKRRGWRPLRGILGLLAVALAAAPPTLVPHLSLPDPAGPHAVGTTNRNFIDESRPETFTPDPTDHRELFVRIWYPAKLPVGETPVPYCENAHEISRALTGPTRAPSFLFDHLALTRTDAYRDAEVAGGGERFPIVVFSHAYWGSVSQSTALMQELASQGYVAVSVGHSFETPYFIEADGTVRAFDPKNEEFRLRGAERQAASAAQQQLSQTTDRAEVEALIGEISRLRPKTIESVHIWSADISSTLDELERLNLGEGILGGRLDLERVGVLGHSLGGAAAGQACLDDERCKAGINLDGLQLGDLLDEDLTRPFLFLHHDNVHAIGKTPNRLFFEKAKGPAYLLTIEGTGHLSFSDLSFYGRGSLFRMMMPGGEIDGERCHRIVCDHVLAFFDQHLRGRDSDLLQGRGSRYPEVEMWTRAPGR